MRILPVVFTWDEADVVDRETGQVERRMVMIPLRRYGNVAARQYVEGQEYPLVPLEARSMASHNRYFAVIAEGFNNLPEGDLLKAIAEQLGLKIPVGGFMHVDHFRKWALCQKYDNEYRWCDVQEHAYDSKEAALEGARQWRYANAYAHLTINENRLTVRIPKSQSHDMTKADFQASSKDVESLLVQLLQISRKDLERNAGRSA